MYPYMSLISLYFHFFQDLNKAFESKNYLPDPYHSFLVIDEISDDKNEQLKQLVVRRPFSFRNAGYKYILRIFDFF